MEGDSDILVLGGGPAGAAAAIGLARLGHRVTVVAAPRPFDACEGLSERSVAGLRQAGCAVAASRLGEPVLRHAAWNGVEAEANRETLADRAAFDAALLEDMASAGVTVAAGHAKSLVQTGEGWQVGVRSADGAAFALTAGFLIEARGRAAPAGRVPRTCGPATTALLQCWRGPTQGTAASVVPFDSGWAWMVRLADGRRYVQFTVSSATGRLPGKAGLATHFESLVAAVPEATAWLDGAAPAAPVAARTAGAVLHSLPFGVRHLRVGDAALAVDPLSGNGLFQALSTGLMAVAVVNTLLRRPEDGALAALFYRERIADSFWRFARIGRDFYRQERRWPEAPFWAERCAWPDDAPAHRAAAAGSIAIATRPVVADGFITAREVVVTPDQPLGIWQLDGVELAPLLRRLKAEPTDADETMKARIARLSGAGPRQVETVAGWLWHRLGPRP
jgi:flavin-dependent dehydrogenase